MMLTKEGNVAESMGEFSGMPRYTARKAIVAKLKEIGLYRGVEDNVMVLKMCSRSKDIIEPMPIPQWNCNIEPMAKMAADAVVAEGLANMKIFAREDKKWRKLQLQSVLHKKRTFVPKVDPANPFRSESQLLDQYELRELNRVSRASLSVLKSQRGQQSLAAAALAMH